MSTSGGVAQKFLENLFKFFALIVDYGSFFSVWRINRDIKKRDKIFIWFLLIYQKYIIESLEKSYGECWKRKEF